MKFFKNKTINLVLIIILAVIVGWAVWKIMQPKPAYATIDQFYAKLNEFSAKADDDKFFSSVYMDENSWILKYKIPEINNAGIFVHNEYIVNISPTIARQLNGSVTEQINAAMKYNEASNLVTELKKTGESLGFINEGKFKPSLWQQILSFIPLLFSFALPILLIVFYYKMLKGSSWGGMGGFFGPQNNSQAVKVMSDKRFSDIAGNKEVKEEVMELVDYLKNPGKYEAAGARIPKGILLGGPPGTGKTLLAKATAGEANVPFFFISASNFVELYVGMGAKRVRELFKEARKEAPAIIFIDELDAVGRSRGSGIGGGNDEREQTLNQLLVEMDGMTDNSGILVIAATNRTDVLDPALQRPGRFDRTITVNYPDIKEREEILKLHARGKRVDGTIDFKNIAKRTPGFSGAQLENVINEASILSVRENTKVITATQIDEAIDRVMSGPAKKHRTITEQERTMVAYHEAGHAVVGIKLPGGNKVQKITIIPRGNAGGYNLMLPENEKYNATKSELLATIASFMGGRAAEEIMYGAPEISTGAANDIEKATKIARRMVTEFGMSSLGPIQYEENSANPFLGRDYAKNMSFSHQVGHEIDLEVRKIISEAYEKAVEIINSNKELLELIKDSLLENETIVAEEIEYIAKNMKLPVRDEVSEKKSKDLDLDELIESVSNKENETDLKDKQSQDDLNNSDNKEK
ncbi:ATP-dependent zinc metalloprotease FtsH [Mesomycoplasma lagogenitalium]|uniref:ATP-dependent zinc metalloprotease FtsH n=1 Tax=Mesomycoplasma lagogenitalium TaxID=171286 RepID=A0ABY8LTQ0_9BACT|nr:ATP-dependent zinc metalloprotease FtsH [Mesomycoplasma lagogenitalium]WGI36625.1 ATP-dependent zinc metalloprotease FtsH [Mesomycoplasma lagogenitalium]